MEMFHAGTATTLVATDVAARGIHVDDVALVVHADPPSEHKAYLHRSGRTARAGADGTVVTLMTDEQTREVRALTRAAGINPTTTKLVGPTHAVLAELKPGVRSTPGGLVATVAASSGGGRSGGGGNRKRSTGSGPASAGAGGGRRGRRGGQGGGSQGGGQGGARRNGRSGGSGAPARSGAARPASGSSRPHSAASFSSRAR